MKTARLRWMHWLSTGKHDFRLSCKTFNIFRDHFRPTRDVGAVCGLRRIKNAVAVAKEVLLRTEHSILVGESGHDNFKFKQQSKITG